MSSTRTAGMWWKRWDQGSGRLLTFMILWVASLWISYLVKYLHRSSSHPTPTEPPYSPSFVEELTSPLQKAMGRFTIVNTLAGVDYLNIIVKYSVGCYFLSHWCKPLVSCYDIHGRRRGGLFLKWTHHGFIPH